MTGRRTVNDANVLHSPQVSLDKHLDPYDYLMKLVGDDHIGMGPEDAIQSLLIDSSWSVTIRIMNAYGNY